ncbi:MAG: type II toxin-antitoxin system death-on-curing family toxin [Luteimonas sp.]
MSDVHWLHAGVVEAVHLRQLSEHGGAAGVRDRGLLDTALAKPLQLASYGDPPPDLCALAAAYGHGLAHLHPFVDGNKRTSFVATLLFLRLNGQDLAASSQARYDTWLALAAGELSESALADWLRQRIAPSPD